jgi:hypothetical protein
MTFIMDQRLYLFWMSHQIMHCHDSRGFFLQAEIMSEYNASKALCPEDKKTSPLARNRE